MVRHWSETWALWYLRCHGLSLLERNFLSRMGEIDLIMIERHPRHGDVLVFIEVRYRRRELFGGAAASVTKTKQHRLIRTALVYLKGRQISEPAYRRFDVMVVTGKLPFISTTWMRGAFSS